MKRVIGHFVLILLKLCVLLALAAGLYRLGCYAYDFGVQVYSEEGVSDPPGQDVAVVVFEGETVQEIGEMLERFGLIRDALVFRVQERLSEYHGQLQPGNYVLNTSMSGNDMIAIMSGHADEVQTTETSES